MPDLLIREVRLVPLTPRRPDHTGAALDVLIVGGAVREIGRGLTRPSGVEQINADGRWAIPGLWDQHTHLGQWAATAERLDLSATSSADEVLDAVAAQLRRAPGEPVIGAGMRAASWPHPARTAALDAVTGTVPVALINGDCHHGWCNSAALRILDLPPRDSVVAEDEWFTTYPLLDRLTGGPTTPAAYRRMLRKAAARGIVGMIDFEFGAHRQDWVARWDGGCDLLNITVAVYPDGLADVVSAGLRTGDLLATTRNGAALRMGPLKILSDGSIGTQTAWCCAPYANDPNNFGAPNFSSEQLTSLMSQALSSGLDVATHAIGDRALNQALEGYAATGARGTIEHAQLATDAGIKEMARLGLTASIQPAHLFDDRDLSDQVWPDRTQYCFAFRSMLDAGVDVVLGSDAPVAALDPWLAIKAAVHRSADDRPQWHPEQALTCAEAIACSTNGQLLQPGSPGDVVLLDRDPLADNPTELHTMPVAVTAVGGRVIHDAR